MKTCLFCRGIVFVWGLTLAALAAPPETLTFADLKGNVDRWPATVNVLVNVRTKSGQTALQGQKLPVTNVTENAVFVRNQSGGLVGLSPQQCDVVQQASAKWSKLTPAQRALDAATVLKDSSLWPDTVRFTNGARITDAMGLQKVLPIGTPAAFLYFANDDVGIVPQGVGQKKWFKPDAVDLLEGARERLLLAPDKRPSRLIEAVRPLLRGADGRPVTPASLEQTKVFAFFWGANWCGWCHKFSPELAAWVNKNAAKSAGLTVVMLDGDKQQSEMLKYLKEKKLPWPGVAMADWQRVPYFAQTHENSFPRFFLCDRFGKILYNAGGGAPEDIARHLAALDDAVKRLN